MNLCEETGKIIYERHSDAEKQLDAINKRKHGKAGKAYVCQWCRGWHLTTKCKPTLAQRKRKSRDAVFFDDED